MRYTFTISEDLHKNLAEAVFSAPGREGAAYVLCGVSRTETETRLLAREVVPVDPKHYLRRENDGLSIASDSYVSIAKRARLSRQAVLFVHSHPEHYPDFSPQDDREEPKLMAFLQTRASELPHGALVLSSWTAVRGRVWEGNIAHSLSRVRTIGRRFLFVDPSSTSNEQPIPEFFDRQVRAFGPDVQRLLRRLHVGVIGAGGTGSATIEQLTRLGVGTISVFEGDVFEGSNVTRVYGSAVTDEGESKAVIQARHVNEIGVGTHLIVHTRHITEEATARELRKCDIIFGCTDKHAPRGIMVRLALRYLIPCIDMAVKVHSEEGMIRGIWGRVTTIFPGEACLFCRGTIDPETIRAESLPPDQRHRETEEGYLTEIATREPAVIMFTTAVAAQAVSEMLHRLTGFMGADRQSTETLLFFHESRIRTNRQPPSIDCICQRKDMWGTGDSLNFLGLIWPAVPITVS